MSKEGIKEIRKRIFYIICTLLFLIISTILWSDYRNKINLRKQADNDNIFAMANEVEFRDINNFIDVNSLGKVTDSEATLIKPYKFGIKNISKDTKEVLLCFMNNTDKNNTIPNNYIKYRIKKDDEEYSDIRNLSIDGKIYVDKLEPNKESVYSIQYWIDYDVYDSVKNKVFNSKILLIKENNF